MGMASSVIKAETVANFPGTINLEHGVCFPETFPGGMLMGEIWWSEIDVGSFNFARWL